MHVNVAYECQEKEYEWEKKKDQSQMHFQMTSGEMYIDECVAPRTFVCTHGLSTFEERQKYRHDMISNRFKNFQPEDWWPEEAKTLAKKLTSQVTNPALQAEFMI